MVGAGSSAQFDGMAVVGHDQVALRCDGGRLWLADTYVGRGAGTAVTGQDCDLHVEGGQPWDNHRGAILLEGDSRLTMADAVVALNGQPFEPLSPSIYAGAASTSPSRRSSPTTTRTVRPRWPAPPG